MVGKTFLKNKTFVAYGQGSLHSSGGLAHEGLTHAITEYFEFVYFLSEISKMCTMCTN